MSEKKRESEAEREERERERERTTKISQEKITPTIPTTFVDFGHISLGFSKKGISRAADTLILRRLTVYNGELVHLMGNQRVGNFPAKIRNHATSSYP